MKKVAFVPARSGSKRLIDKNIKPFCGLPLVCWTINAFLESNCFDSVIFSSDSAYYWNVVSDYIHDNRLSFHKRSPAEAGDAIKLFDYVRANYNTWCDDNDLLGIGLPTAPLRSSLHIIEAVNMSLKGNTSIFSASEYEFPVSFAFSLSSSSDCVASPPPLTNLPGWKPLIDNSPMNTGNTRSQDQNKFFHPNGAIYIINGPDRLKDVNSFYQISSPYIMPSKYSVDVDTEEDFLLAERMLRSTAT